MPIQFYNGKILFENGKIAVDPACCCASCWTRWESTYDCVNGEWNIPTAAENQCLLPTDLEPTPTTWTQTSTDPCVVEIWVSSAIACDPLSGVLCTDGTPPSKPTLTEPTGCCDADACWIRWESTYDCSLNSWGTPAAVEKKCVAAEESSPTPTGWTITGDLCIAEIWVSNGTDCVSPDTTGCPDGSAPSAPGIGEPSGCCATHKLIDCNGVQSPVLVKDDSNTDWSALVSDTSYDDFVIDDGSSADGDSNGRTLKFSEDATDSCWYVEKATAEATITTVTITESFVDCKTCIGDKCWTRWESSFDCIAGEWGTPTAVEKQCVPTADSDPSPINWTITTVDDCVAEIWVETADNCIEPDSSECPDGIAPSAPTLATPTGCCDICWTRWESTYDCSTDTWSDPAAAENRCVPTTDPAPNPASWTITGVGSCTAEIWVETTDTCEGSDISGCADGTPPSKPTLTEPTGCCDGDACWTRWESTYDCSLNSWGTPAAVEKKCVDVSANNPNPTSWTITSDPCVAERWISTGEGCDSPDASGCADGTTPSAPSLGEPTGCCDKCWTRWESTYDCSSGSWGTPTVAEKDCVASTASTPTPTSWTITSGDDCVAEKWVKEGSNCDTVSDCPDGAVPAAPSLGKPTGCCTGKCWVRWESTYVCGTGWGTSTVAEKDCVLPEDPDPSPASWTITSGDDCVAEIWVKEGSDCTCNDWYKLTDCNNGEPAIFTTVDLSAEVSNVVKIGTDVCYTVSNHTPDGTETDTSVTVSESFSGSTPCDDCLPVDTSGCACSFDLPGTLTLEVSGVNVCPDTCTQFESWDGISASVNRTIDLPIDFINPNGGCIYKATAGFASVTTYDGPNCTGTATTTSGPITYEIQTIPSSFGPDQADVFVGIENIVDTDTFLGQWRGIFICDGPNITDNSNQMPFCGPTNLGFAVGTGGSVTISW